MDIRLVYLDSAATSQKPIQVIEAVSTIIIAVIIPMFTVVFTHLEQEQQMLMKVHVKRFVNLLMQNQLQEIIFTRGTTTALNIVASSYGKANLR